MAGTKKDKSVEEKLIALLEKQKQELVIRTLQKHEEMKGEKTFTDNLIANLNDILIILNGDLEIVKVNREFTRCLGYEVEEARGLGLKKLVPARSYAELDRLIRSGEFKNHETELINKEGRRFLASMNGSAVESAPGKKSLYLLMARDKTEIYDMMARVRESQMQLIHSGRLASLGEMAAGIAHELTQPLNAILLFARNGLKALSEKKAPNPLLEENLTFIVDRVKKASSIIKSLKSFARKTEEDKIPLDVNSLLRDMLKFLDAQLQLSDIAVEVHLNDAMPPVMAHNVRLEQVFLNIIQNAFQAMVKTENPRLVLKTGMTEKTGPDGVRRQYGAISIADNGEGMSPEVRSKIFDPFFTTREVGAGMGIGLSIADRIMREHSGFMEVESSPGKGSEFILYLPLAERGPSRNE